MLKNLPKASGMSVTSLIKLNVYQPVACVEEGEDNWPPSHFMELIEWLNEISADIPPNLLQSTRCEITAVGGDDGNPPIALIKIGYLRPENPEEAEARIQNTADIAERQHQREIIELERLLNKYPEHRK
jgi:hypothetical protein